MILDPLPRDYRKRVLWISIRCPPLRPRWAIASSGSAQLATVAFAKWSVLHIQIIWHVLYLQVSTNAACILR